MATSQNLWSGLNVLVTGSTGFVGSWLVRSLAEKGARVTCLVRDLHPTRSKMISETFSQVENLVMGDVCDYFTLERVLQGYQIEACFHLAAQAIVGIALRSPLTTFESNVRGTWNLLEACRNSKSVARVVVASSDKAYGEPVSVPITEEHPLLARYPYDASKACADIISRTFYETYELPVAVARCSNIYGGGDLNFSRLVPDTVRSVLLGRNPVIRSDGTPVRDYLYVKDAVDAYLTLGENVRRSEVTGQAFNFGTGKPISVLDLVNKIVELSERKSLKPVIKGSKQKEIDIQYLSCEKARRVLNWAPKFSLEEGLSETLRWYEQNIHLLERRGLGGQDA